MKTKTTNELKEFINLSIDKFSYSNLQDYVPNYMDPKISFIFNIIPEIPQIIKEKIADNNENEKIIDDDLFISKTKRNNMIKVNGRDNYFNMHLYFAENIKKFYFQTTEGVINGPYSMIESFCFYSLFVLKDINLDQTSIKFHDLENDVRFGLKGGLKRIIELLNKISKFIPILSLVNSIDKIKTNMMIVTGNIAPNEPKLKFCTTYQKVDNYEKIQMLEIIENILKIRIDSKKFKLS